MLGHRGAPSPYPLLLPRWSWLATLGEEEEEVVVARGGEEKGGGIGPVAVEQSKPLPTAKNSSSEREGSPMVTKRVLPVVTTA